MRIPLHSVTDLITNSSTTIFTYSEGSEKALVEMINELFKTFGIFKKCEDVFDTVVLADKDRYTEAEDYGTEGIVPEGLSSEEVEKLYEDVASGKAEKPEWFKEIEEAEDSWSYYTPSTYLHLIPKKEEYKVLANKIYKFLYSTDHEATHD